MDILFIHNNYPAQFFNLCSQIANNDSHRVVFLSSSKNNNQFLIKGIKRKELKINRAENTGMSEYLLHIEGGFLLYQAVFNALLELKKFKGEQFKLISINETYN